MKTLHTKGVAHPGNKIHIPLSEDEALKALFKVKPTKDMPRPGATKKSLNAKGMVTRRKVK